MDGSGENGDDKEPRGSDEITRRFRLQLKVSAAFQANIGKVAPSILGDVFFLALGIRKRWLVAWRSVKK